MAGRKQGTNCEATGVVETAAGQGTLVELCADGGCSIFADSRDGAARRATPTFLRLPLALNGIPNRDSPIIQSISQMRSPLKRPSRLHLDAEIQSRECQSVFIFKLFEWLWMIQSRDIVDV